MGEGGGDEAGGGGWGVSEGDGEEAGGCGYVFPSAGMQLASKVMFCPKSRHCLIWTFR